MLSALQGIQQNSCPRFPGAGYSTNHGARDIQIMTQRIIDLEVKHSEQASICIKLKNELHFNEGAYGALLQKSLQMNRELEAMKDQLQRNKANMEEAVHTINKTRLQVDSANRVLREKLQNLQLFC